MSINKNAYIRYQVLDRCFSNSFKNYFIEDLLEEVNQALEDFNGSDFEIKRRQLFDDIRFMESPSGWSIPLERIKSGRRVHYRYSEKDYSIKNQKISEREIEAINNALMVLVRFKGLPQFEWVNELIPKLQSTFKAESQDEVIGFDHNEFLKGLELLPKLYQSIINKVPLVVQYKSFKQSRPKQLIFHPYYLKQYNKRWFAFGVSQEDLLIHNLALDRILSIENSQVKYLKNSDVNFNEFFEDIIGVSRSKEDHPIKIELLFDSETAQYVLTKPLHGSQKKVRQDENGLLIELEVIPNFELRQMILSYGKGVEVKSPQKYRDYVAETIENMMSTYEKSKSSKKK